MPQPLTHPLAASRSESESGSHDPNHPRTIAAGEFKARCLKLLDEVAETGDPLIITKFGKPVAKVVAIEKSRPQLFGAMRGTVLREGDIISPIEDAWGWFGEP